MKTHTARAVGAASLFVSGVTLAHVGRRLDGGLRRDVDAGPDCCCGCRPGCVDRQARWQVTEARLQFPRFFNPTRSLLISQVELTGLSPATVRHPVHFHHPRSFL